jgi:hypothetical protein
MDPAVAAYLEGVIIEQLASVAASLERTIGLQKETKALAELSGKLYAAEETAAELRKKGEANERKALRQRAINLGLSALALVLAIAVGVVSKWARELFAEDVQVAAAEAVETKAVPIELTATTVDVRMTAMEGRQSAVERDVHEMKTGITEILARLPEPATKVHVPQQRKRPR